MPSVSSGTSTPWRPRCRRFGPRDALDGALPNSSGFLLSLRSMAYDRKVGISAPPAGIVRTGTPRPSRAATPATNAASPPSTSSANPTVARSLRAAGCCTPRRTGASPTRTADREHDDVDAVEQFRHANAIALLPGLLVDADQANSRPRNSIVRRGSSTGRGRQRRDEGTPSARSTRRARTSARSRRRRARAGEQHRSRSIRPRTTRCGGCERRTRAAALRHLIALEPVAGARTPATIRAERGEPIRRESYR